MLVDSHCHLDFPEFADDLDAVLARAAEAGVGSLLAIGTRLTRVDRVRALAEAHPAIHCTLGIHPHNVDSEPAAGPGDLLSLAEHPKVVGFGETGLDYFYQHSGRETQQRSFRTHIAAARETGLPVVIHSRDADPDMAAILRDEHAKGPFPGLIHCFSSGREVAETAIELGLYVSLSGIITFKAADDLRATVRGLPLDRLLIETDSPYLAPVPKRGKRNEPAFVAHTAIALAGVLGLEPEEVVRATTENFFVLFRKATRPEAVI